MASGRSESNKSALQTFQNIENYCIERLCTQASCKGSGIDHEEMRSATSKVLLAVITSKIKTIAN